LKKYILYLIGLFFILDISNAQKPDIYQLSGFVKSELQEGLPFVHIIIKNKRRGTISDFQGFFSLVVEKNDTLIFSSIGYKKTSFYVGDTVSYHDYFITKILESDTITLNEMVIFPWNTYEQFKEAFLKLDAPKDDIDRAIKNFALIEEQLKKYPADSDPSLNYKYFMQQTYNQLYYTGQLPPNNLLNPIAWAQFFSALRNGDFKRKEK